MREHFGTRHGKRDTASSLPLPDMDGMHDQDFQIVLQTINLAEYMSTVGESSLSHEWREKFAYSLHKIDAVNYPIMMKITRSGEEGGPAICESEDP